jgi:hypothetical protein
MTGLLILGLIVAAFVALDLAVLAFGVDTRSGFDGREPQGDVA